MITWLTPIATSMDAEISPVKAPCSAKCMFWAPTKTAEPFTECSAVGKSTAGGQMMISLPVTLLPTAEKYEGSSVPPWAFCTSSSWQRSGAYAW